MAIYRSARRYVNRKLGVVTIDRSEKCFGENTPVGHGRAKFSAGICQNLPFERVPPLPARPKNPRRRPDRHQRHDEGVYARRRKEMERETGFEPATLSLEG